MTMTDDVQERLDRLESILEDQRETITDQQETIEDQQSTIDRLRERLVALDEGSGTPASEDDVGDETVEAEETTAGAADGGSLLATGPSLESIDPRAVLGRRRTLATAGLFGLGGLGAGVASARQGSPPPGTPGGPPQGQVGTGGRPLQTLYTQAIDGPITGGTEVADLLGDGMTVTNDALTADLATGLEFDGGAVGLDLDAIAGENMSVDPATGELDAAAGGSYSGASAYLSTDQNTSGETQVQLDAVSYDAGNDVDRASGTYTAPESGIYSVTFKAYTDAHLVSIHVNGSAQVNGEPPILSKTLHLSQGDTVAAFVDGGGTVYAGPAETYLTVDRLG